MARDRTAEFFQVADQQIKLRARAPVARPRPPKSAFGQHALRLGKTMHTIEGRTTRLAKLACKSSLFDDPAAEIGEVSTAVRHELAGVASGLEALGNTRRTGGRQAGAHYDAVMLWLKTRVSSLSEDFQAALKQREATISAKESRAAKLSGVSSLASPFAGTVGAQGGAPAPSAAPVAASRSDPFAQFGAGGGAGGRMVQKSQLLQRRRPGPGGGGAVMSPPNHPQQQQPGSCGGGGGGYSSAQPASAQQEAHPQAKGAHHGGGAMRQRVYHDLNACGFGGTPEAGGGAGGAGGGSGGWSYNESDALNTPQELQERQQQFWTPRSQRHREQEVSAMQSTLADIGQMFQKFGAVVAEQGELIARIDSNTEQALGHIGEAHEQIKKFERTTRGDRALILKVFGVLFFFIVVYGTLYR